MRNMVATVGALSVACTIGIGQAHGQTVLGPGDLAFSGYGSTGTDRFSFVLLRDVSAGTVIRFTDRGWLAAGGFRSGEGQFELTLGADYECGAELLASMSPLEVFDSAGELAGTVSGGGLQLSTSGDQVFAYQGLEPAAGEESGLLAAIQMNGDWDADATSTNTSARPATFIDGVHAVAVAPEVNNARYDCAVASGDSAVLGTAIQDAAHWERDDTTPFDLTVGCGFLCNTVEPPSPAPQSKDQQKCLNAMFGRLAVVAGVQGTEILKCVKHHAKGRNDSAEMCVAADELGKIAKARSKVADLEEKKCVEAPDFGYTDGVATADAAVDAATGSFEALFGVAFDDSILLDGADSAAARCQRGIALSAKKCLDARLKELGRCVKKGLKKGAIMDLAGLAACVGTDEKGKIAAACDLGVAGDEKVDRLRRSLGKLCVDAGVLPSVVLPACPGGIDVETAHACVAPKIACRACLAANAAFALNAACDDVDDGQPNGSCPI